MRRRLLNLLTALSLLMCVVTAVAWARIDRPGPDLAFLYGAGMVPGPGDCPSTAATQAWLAFESPSGIRFEQVRLQEVVDLLFDLGARQMEVDWPALAEAGVGPNTLMTLTRPKPRIGEILAGVMNLGSGVEILFRDGEIRISTRAALDREYDRSGPAPHGSDDDAAKAVQPIAWEGVFGSRRFMALAHRGALRLWLTPADPMVLYRAPCEASLEAQSTRAKGDHARSAFAGFLIWRRGYPYRWWVVDVPYWALTVITALPPLIWMGRAAPRIRRRRSGLCARCGYDLRATRNRCPECGHAVESVS